MKKVFLAFALYTLYSPGICFSQNSKFFPAHPVVRDLKKSSPDMLQVQSTLADLYGGLIQTTIISCLMFHHYLI